MQVLRTPDERFANLPDYPFAPKYAVIPDGAHGTLRVHYVDEGPREGRAILCLHGEPTWSFLYRKMIPPLAAAGYRAIAPDLVGFGRSDKPADRADYTYARHLDWLRASIDALGLQRIVLVAQDWGGLLGLRLVAEMPERFDAVVVANTFLPTGDEPPNAAFARWRDASQRMPRFDAGSILARTCTPPLTDDIAAAYDAPFPDESFCAGARAFPMLVPTTPDDVSAVPNRAAWEMLRRFEKPTLCAFSDGDPITRGAERYFQANVPGTQNVAHATISGASHFLQEDRPDELVAAILDFLARAQV